MLNIHCSRLMVCKTFTIHIYASFSACMLVWFISLVYLLIWQGVYLYVNLQASTKKTFVEICRYGDFLLHSSSSSIARQKRWGSVCLHSRCTWSADPSQISKCIWSNTHAIITQGTSTKQAGAAESKQEKCFWLNMESGDCGRWISTYESWGKSSSTILIFSHLPPIHRRWFLKVSNLFYLSEMLSGQNMSIPELFELLKMTLSTRPDNYVKPQYRQQWKLMTWQSIDRTYLLSLEVPRMLSWVSVLCKLRAWKDFKNYVM